VWVDEHEYNKDKNEDDEMNEYVFSFFNDELGEEYDEYQEETMNIDDVLECYEKMHDYDANNPENIKKMARYDIIDELQDILLDEKDFKKADEIINENNIDMSECDVIMENAIGLEEMEIAEYLIKKGMKIDNKLIKEVKRCNQDFRDSFMKMVKVM
jgi:tetratricopeptide (TPR) repeat protein